jgi:oleate hydratase
MLNFSYLCLHDLLRQVPSLTDDKKSVLPETEEFNADKGNRTHDMARLVSNHVHADRSESARFDDGRKFGMSGGDRLKLVKVMMQPEHSLGKKTIQDCFDETFFTSNFWYMWCSMYVTSFAD